MSDPIFPFDVWPAGIEQASVPANANALRSQILFSEAISDTETTEPPTPADGDVYIIAPGATGTSWALFDADDLAIFRDDAWYAFAPLVGVRMTVAGADKIFAGSGGWVDFSASVSWGGIIGTLSDQTDLQAALDAKAGIAPVVTIMASETLAIGRSGQFVLCDHASTLIDVEVPPQSSVAWAANTEIHFHRTGLAEVSFSAGAGVTITFPASQVLAVKETGGVVSLKRIASDVWVAFGALEEA